MNSSTYYWCAYKAGIWPPFWSDLQSHKESIFLQLSWVKLSIVLLLIYFSLQVVPCETVIKWPRNGISRRWWTHSCWYCLSVSGRFQSQKQKAKEAKSLKILEYLIVFNEILTFFYKKHKSMSKSFVQTVAILALLSNNQPLFFFPLDKTSQLI